MEMSRTLADAPPAGWASSPTRAAGGRAVPAAVAAWAWPAAALAMVAISLAPFLVVDVPAVLDYPNHLARFYILAHPHDPILSRMYAPHWAILPNVGMDVLGTALLTFLPPHVGGRILLGLSLLAPPAGAMVYARAAFGRWTWWSLGAGVLAYNGIFFLGFMNFLLGLGVALAGAGAWRVLRQQDRNRAAVAACAAIGLVAFFCHLLGYGFFALLIAAQEIEPLIGLARRRQLAWRTAVLSAALVTIAVAPTAIVYVLSHRAGGRGDLPGWNWAAKPLAGFLPFMIYNSAATIFTAVVMVSVAVLVWRRSSRASGVGLTLAAVIGLFLVAPAAAGGGTFVDARLPLVAALMLFAGLSPRLPPTSARVIAAAFAVLIVGRAAVVAANWIGHAHDLANLRTELADVPPGSTILPAWTGAPIGEETAGRELPRYVLLNHNLPALAVIERRAFWPLEFADPSQQPMEVRAPYRAIAEPTGWSAPWVSLLDDPPTPKDVGEHSYLRDWRRRFDFVLLTGPPPDGRPPAGLVLVRTDAATSLYRIVR